MGLPPLVEPAGPLTAEEVRRYGRHLVLPEVGATGQRRLKGARVLCVGAGGLGSPVLLYLAAAGVGTLGVVDPDVVDESNLQRQVLHGLADVGRPKVDSARDAVAALNPLVAVEAYPTAIDASNALGLVGAYDLVVDGSDNFATRYLVNDACALTGRPYVWGSIYRFAGQASVFWAGRGPCYRCLYPEPPPPDAVPSCAEGGVLGAVCAAVGSVQAAEAVKLVTGIGEPLLGRLLLLDVLAMRHREVRVPADPACPVCGDDPTVTELADYAALCGVPGPPGAAPAGAPAAGAASAGAPAAGAASAGAPAAGAPAAGPTRPAPATPTRPAPDAPTRPAPAPGGVAASEVTAADLAAMLAARGRGGADFLLVDVREPAEAAEGAIPGSVLLPMGEFWSGAAVDRLPRDRPVVLYCRIGQRSAQALAVLHAAGFADAVHLAGGILAWQGQVGG